MRGQVGRALSGLTVRGRGLVAAGVALLLAGMLLGERPMVQIAVFVLALPVLSTVLVARERFRVSSRRLVSPARVPRGEAAEVRLELTNADRRPGGLWLLTEHVPGELGPAPSFVVDRLAGGDTAVLHYGVSGLRRGRYALGPLRLRLVDPFGLVVRSVAGSDTVPVVVAPLVHPLGAGGPGGGHGGGGQGARRSIAVHGEDDVSTREYRHGDDLRKVHWKATARTGELMVRLEERPWRAQATLFLDTRNRAHLLAPGPRPGDPAPARGEAAPDSLEWLIEAAASIGTALARRGSVLRVVTDAGELTPRQGQGGLGPEELLDRLAAIRPSRNANLAAGVEQLCRAAGEGPVVCLLGSVGPDDVAELARARSGPTTDFAVLTDVVSWADPAARGRRAPTAAARAELERQRQDTAALLGAAGWNVAVASADRGVAEVWAELAQTRSAAGVPAGLAAGLSGGAPAPPPGPQEEVPA